MENTNTDARKAAREIAERIFYSKAYDTDHNVLFERGTDLILNFAQSYPATLDKGAQFVKASERMPTNSGRYVAKRFGEYIIVEARQLRNGNDTGKFVFCVVGGNGAQFKGWKSFEWLDESLSEQPEAKKIFLIQSKETLRIHGCFYSKERAERFIENSNTMWINEIGII